MSLDRPILVVGAARSGTTLLGELLSAHPDVAYWIEPKYVWQYGKPLSSDDVRTANEATGPVRAYIRRRFERYAAKRGRARFMEKTPSNCFRIPFIEAVFPDARYVHILRDGRDVTVSAFRKWTTPPVRDALWRRAISFEVPLADIPGYAVAILRGLLVRRFHSHHWHIWGPRHPGILEDRAGRSLLEVCALQWRHSVEFLTHDLQAVDPGRVLTLRFEALLADPPGQVSRVMDFLDLPASEGVAVAAAAHTDADAKGRWPEWTSRAEWPDVEAILAPLMRALGYE